MITHKWISSNRSELVPTTDVKINLTLPTRLTSGPLKDSMSAAARPKRWGVSRQAIGREFNPTTGEHNPGGIKFPLLTLRGMLGYLG
jgi:hypothetical protein